MPLSLDEKHRLLQSLPGDTRALVAACYTLDKVDKKLSVTIKAPQEWGDDTINPGLFFAKFCLDAYELKEYKNGGKYAFQEGWKTASQAAKAQAQAVCARRAVTMQTLQSSGWNAPAPLQAEVVWRMVIGMGSAHPLENGFTLHPLYGFPLIPASAVKGLARHYRLSQIGHALGVYPQPGDAAPPGQAGPIPAPAASAMPTGQTAPRPASPPAASASGDKIPTPLQMLERLLVWPPATNDMPANEKRARDRAKLLAALAQANRGLKRTAITEAEIEAEYGLLFRAAFGTQETQGRVMFFDALPLAWTFKVDVMTPHYGEYYTGGGSANGSDLPQTGDNTPRVKTPPADYLDPIPVTFLTLDKGTRFRFDVACRQKHDSVSDPAGASGNAASLAGLVRGWLMGGLKEFGAGGKTAAGYGEMRERKQP